MGVKEKKDRFFADWVSLDTHHSLDRFAGPSLAACAQVKSQKLFKVECGRLGMIWRKACRVRNNSNNDWFSRETAFVPEIGKVVTIASGRQYQYVTEPRDDLSAQKVVLQSADM